jgi:hypothetical protein
MPAAGGPTTQSGILFQSRAAALWLGRLLHPRDRSRKEWVTSVRVEALDAVDDIVVTFGDRHCEHIQVKEKLERSGEVWDGLWADFAEQRAGADFEEDSRLVLLGHEPPWARSLRDLCERACGCRPEEWPPEPLPESRGRSPVLVPLIPKSRPFRSEARNADESAA